MILLAERTLFLPSIGVVLALGGAVALALADANTDCGASARLVAAACGALKPAARRLALASPVNVLGGDSHTLWFASVRDAPRSWRVQHGYAEALFDIGRPDLALAAYDRAIQWAPQPWSLRNDLSQRLRQGGDDADALTQLRLSLAQEPGRRAATVELVSALLGLGQYSEAGRIADSVVMANRSFAAADGHKAETHGR